MNKGASEFALYSSSSPNGSKYISAVRLKDDAETTSNMRPITP